MTLQQLGYIVAIDNHRNFVKAAESCFVTQPTLTMQVRKVESEANIIIFDRSRKPVVPTPIGEEFIARARQILREAEQLRYFVNEEKESLAGSFRIGIIPTLAPYVLPLFLAGFTSDHPNTQLIIREMQSEEIITSLKQNLLDIAIIVTPLHEADLKEIPMYLEPFLGYFPSGHPMLEEDKLNTDMLETDSLLLLAEGHCFRNQTLSLCKYDPGMISRSVEYQSGSIETLKNLVDKELGYTLIPELAISGNDDRGRIRRFSAPEPTREVSLVVHKSFPRENLLDTLRGSILDMLPSNLQTVRPAIKLRWRF